MLSTLEAYFAGKKELFKGLAIEQLEKDWLEHPVLHLDLNTEIYNSPEHLIYVLEDALHNWERLYGNSETEKTPELRFKGIIRRAYEKTGQRVVVLIDEYDKPMLQAIGHPELQETYRSLLKAFYGVLKSADGYVCFEALNMDYDTVCREMKRRYDGYHFMEDTEGLYNPFSLLNTFNAKQFGSYWFATGTPSYLVELLKRHHYDLDRLAHEETDAETLEGVDSVDSEPIPVIYQSGYLTIKEYDSRFGTYRLGFPNLEVEEGFIKLSRLA